MSHDALANRRIWLVFSAAVVAGVVAVGIAAVLLRVWRGPVSTAAPERAGTRVAEIQQTPIRTDRPGLAQREAARAALDHYGWADRDAGVAQIPIGAAMDLVVSELAQDGGP